MASDVPPSPTLPSNHQAKGYLTSLSKKRKNHATLADKIAHLRLPIHPIYPLPAGSPHPNFPHTLLDFWLLSESDCDSIASYYHQLSPTNPYHNLYPANMNWDADFLRKPDSATMTEEEVNVCLGDEDRRWVKKRMVGKFIGFSWCRTPVKEVERKVRWIEEMVDVRVRREREVREKVEDKSFRGLGRPAW